MNNLEKINLNHVKNISKYAISMCPKLNSINFGDSLMILEESALHEASLLNGCNFPPTLQYIGKECFQSSNVTSIIINSDNIVLESFSFHNLANLKSVEFKGKTADIKHVAFVSSNLEIIK